MARVKICGITNLGDALIAEVAGADIIGLIFADSPRRVSVDEAVNIINKLPQSVKICALFVNEREEVVRETIARLGRVELLQFHGDETPEYCSRFKGIKVIKAVRIKDEKSLRPIADFKDVDFILLDTYRQDIYGGTGGSFNWDIAVKAKEHGKPIFLSGGLNAGNVRSAVEKVDPFAVDVSSGVEMSPGKKDPELVRKFISQAKPA